MKLLQIPTTIIICSLLVAAQAAPSHHAQTIEECLLAVQGYTRNQLEAARKAGQKIQKPNYLEFQAQAKQLAKQYAARFKVEEVKETELVTLAKLFSEADEVRGARAAINRRLQQPQLGESELAETLATGVEIGLSRTPKDEGAKLGEEFAARLDTLSSGVVKQKLRAHAALANYYSYTDNEEENFKQQTIVLALIAQLSAAEQQAATFQKGVAYQNLAFVLANRGQIDKALEVLRRAQAEFNDSTQFKDLFEQSIQRYLLINQPGAPLQGTYWLNTAPDLKQYELRGQVTLLQFTAHWCGPCRQSYPALLKLHEQFKGQGLEIVMSTRLYGYFGKRANLSAAEEFAANRSYYIDEQRLPFKIAVEPQLSPVESKADNLLRDSNEGRYFLGGYPQMVLVDKQGKVRQVFMGWDPAKETRISKIIQQLLQEPVVTTEASSTPPNR